MHFHIDEVSADHISGWAVSNRGVMAIHVLSEGSPVATVHKDIYRHDVGDSYPDVPGSPQSGFVCVFHPAQFRNTISSLELKIIENGGEETCIQLGDVPTVFGNPPEEKDDLIKETASISPFPLDIQAILVQMKPSLYCVPGQWPAGLVEQAVTDLIWLTKKGSRTLYDLNRYMLYLKSLRSSFETILRLFPRYNKSAQGPKDLFCVASSPEEMLCISHPPPGAHEPWSPRTAR
jgi:hypothetical protein